MSVLVTGGAGYIGSHMVWRLLDAGEEVVVIDRLSAGFDWAVPPEARLVVGDIGDRALVARVLDEHRVEAVFHFAGSIVVPESFNDPLGYYLNNTVNSHALIETCARAEIRRFVFSSTAAVYGAPEDLEPIGEDAPLRPESPYGASKLMVETMLRDTARAHPTMAYACLRYFNVAGADAQGRTGQSSRNATHLIKIATETALGIRPYMEVFGRDYPTPDGTCIRDYVHVGDLVEAHRLALERLRAGAGCLIANCGYGHGYSVFEVIDTVRRVSGRDFEVRHSRRRTGDPAGIVADSARIRDLLGWQPRFDCLETIVAHALEWEAALARRRSAPRK